MANLVRWDPFSEFTPLRQMMDRMMEDAWVRPAAGWNQQAAGSFACDLYETDDDYVLTAPLPGLRPEDLEITVQGNVLTVSGECKADHENEHGHFHVRERRYGRFGRQFSLPAGIQGDRVQANLENGILTLRVPKAEEMKPRRIAVQTRAPAAITGDTAQPAAPRITSGEPVAV